MAIAFLPEPTASRPPSQATACLAVLCSPIRGADGAWRVWRQDVEAGLSLGAVLPETLHVERVIVNGGVLPAESLATYTVLPGDEMLVIPRWGIPAAVVPFLIYAAVGVAVSIAATALTYLLFPPQKAHNIQQRPEEPTFSFEGIRTAVGPGAPVPVIYGRQRVGGQLLSSSVDQVLTVLDNGTAVRRVEAISAPATLTLLLALGEGPVGSIDTTTIEINGQPITNFPGVEIHSVAGFDPQGALLAFGETRNTFADGRPIAEAASSIMYTTTVPVEAFVLNIAFQGGLYAFNPKGEKVENPVTLQYRYRAVGGGFWDWSPFTVVAARTSVVRFGIRKEGLTLAQYDIELQVTNVGTAINAEWQPTLESVTEIQSNTQTYPHTALLGLRALATDALQGALPNVTVEVFGRTVRVGSFATAEAWSDNPAWCTMDFLTNPRYGLGIPDAQMDLAAFQVWAAYCEELVGGEQRHTLNYTLDRDTRAQQVLLEMMGGSRTLLFKSEGLWTPRPTRNDAPVQLLSWANCTDLKLTYTRDQERVNVIEARFANEEQGFEQDVLTWPTIENWPPDLRKTSLEVRGVTKPSRIMRAMQFELNRRHYENLTLEMTCALDAIVLQPHDLFRFSHPLPGWGTSGRIQAGSTTSLLYLDQQVLFGGVQSYIVYVRHEDGTTEVKPVSYPGDVFASTLTLLSPLSQTPAARTSLWAFGYLVGPADTAVRVFRVVRMQRMSDTTVRIQAVIHNASLYNDGEPVVLPVITSLFNPLGPPPGLTSLVLTEMNRISASGASLRVVNVSWDVAGLGAGFAPYGGALILRRTVMDSALGGSGALGTTQAAELQGSGDGSDNFHALTQVTGHVLDFDDYTITSGVTYVYRVVPMSQRGVPNQAGAREATIHVAGPTTPNYFPGTPQNLRLKGQPLGATIFEGPDVHLVWEPIADSSLFTSTFFVADYILEVWAPGQTYLLRRVIVAARGVGVSLEATYTLQMNSEDQLQAGQAGARRDLAFFVWARTNTGRISLTPASLTVSNPPPDMGDMVPTVTALATSALITFDQFVEPRDFDHYQVFLDTVNPPLATYEDIAIGPHGFGRAIRQVAPQGLTPGLTYYTYVLPYDSFGPGIPSHIVSFVPTGIGLDDLDKVPPATPTGLILTQGQTVSDDGTIMNWVQASWNLNIESDMSTYEVQFFVGTSVVPTTFLVSHPTTHVRIENVGGNITVRCRLLAYDIVHNISAFTAEASIVTTGDTAPPGLPSNLFTRGSFRANVLIWTPPADLDYFTTEIWGNNVANNVSLVNKLGEGTYDFVHGGLQSNETWWYWIRSKDTSGNLSAFLQGPTAGTQVTTVQTTNADIGNLSITTTKIADDSISTPKLQANSVDANKVTTGELITLGAQIRNAIITDAHINSLSASKITTGLLDVLVQLGVAGKVFLDGVNNDIYVYDDVVDASHPNGHLRVQLGKLGPLTTHYGLQIFDEADHVMFDVSTGVTADGITAGVISAGHLSTTTAVVTNAIQIANAIITNAHIATVAANKIITGNLTATTVIQVGVTPKLYLDGANNNIYVYDNNVSLPSFPNGHLRAMFGQLGSGVTDYGLRIWNQLDQLMWDFSGAQTPGIAASAVTTPKVAVGAISQNITYYSSLQITTGSAETSAGALATGAINAGDRLWVVFKSVGQNLGSTAAQVEAILYVNDGSTNIAYDVAYLKDSGLGQIVMQTVWTASTNLSSITFHVGFRNALGSELVGMTNINFVVVRFQR